MRRALAIICCALLASACVETIVMDPEEEMPVVVKCILEEGKTQTLSLSYARRPSEEHGEPVDSARACILGTDGDTLARFTRSDTSPVWTAALAPEYGRHYILVVKIPGRDTITARTRFPVDFDLACYYKQFFVDSVEYYGISYEMRTGFTHGETYYHAEYGTRPFNLKCNLWVYGREQGPKSPYSKFITTDIACVDKSNVTPTVLSDLDSFKPDTIAGTWSMLRQILSWYALLYPDLPMHDGFLIIAYPANFDNGHGEKELEKLPHYSKRSFVLATVFTRNYKAPYSWPGDAYMYDVYSVSDEYDRYLQDVCSRKLNKDSDLTYIYDTDNIYTNVIGGTGIFGAKISRCNTNCTIGYKYQ